MHKSTQSSEVAQKKAFDKTFQLCGLFFLLQHFSPEHAGDQQRPQLSDLAVALRSVGDLGSDLAAEIFQPVDDLGYLLDAATTFEVQEVSQ